MSAESPRFTAAMAVPSADCPPSQTGRPPQRHTSSRRDYHDGFGGMGPAKGRDMLLHGSRSPAQAGLR